MTANGARITDSAYCPSCERFIGPADSCPYCYTDSAKPPISRVLRYGALLLGVAGLACLYLMAAYGDIPLIRMGDLTPMMNFAYVRISGNVEKNANVGKKNGKVNYVSFIVNDGSGEIQVAAYGDVARRMVARDMAPNRGASVEVEGSLNVAADGKARLRLQDAARLRIKTK